MEKANNLTWLEQKTIQILMFKQPVDFIAMVIGRPIFVVQQKIRELTRGQPSGYQKLIWKKEAAYAAKKLSREKKKIVEVARGEIKRISHRPGPRVAEKIFKNKTFDLSKMKALRLDARTVAFVNPSKDMAVVKKIYQERDPTFLKPVNPNKVVKKFKPTKERR